MRHLDENKARADSRSQRSVEQRRAWGRRSAIVAGLACVALAAVAAAAVLARQKGRVEAREREARHQRSHAVARLAEAELEGALAALSRGGYLEARARARASLEAADTPAARLLWRRLSRGRIDWVRRPARRVHAVVFSPGDETVAAASADGVVLFDRRLATSRRLGGHQDPALALAYSVDGRLLAAGDAGGGLIVHGLAPGTERVRRLLARGPRVGAVAFGGDGALVAGLDDGTLRLWRDPAGTAPPRTVRGAKQRGIEALAFSPDGARLATGDGAGLIRLWGKALSAPPLAELTGHRGPVRTLAFRRQGGLLASAGADGTIRLWDSVRGTLRGTLAGHFAAVRHVAFSPDGARLVSAGQDRKVRLWRVEDRRLLGTLGGFVEEVTSAALSHDGTKLAISAGPVVQLRDLVAAAAPSAGHRGVVLGADFGPGDRLVASGGRDRTVRLWDAASGAQRSVLAGARGDSGRVRVSPAGRRLVVGSDDGVIRLWDPNRQVITARLVGHAGRVRAAVFSPDGRRVVSGGSDATVRLWNAVDGGELRRMTGHRRPVTAVAVSPRGRWIASASHDRTVRLWDLRSGRQRAVLGGHAGRVWSVAWGPRGRYLVSGGGAGALRAWDARTRNSRELWRYPGRVQAVAFDRQGRRLAVGGSDHRARIFTLAGAKKRGRRAGGRMPAVAGEPLVLDLHRGGVNDVRFSRDGQTLVTSSDDGTVRLWDVETGRPRWRGPALVVGPAGARLLTHRGWRAVGVAGGDVGAGSPASSWQRALVERGVLADLGRRSGDRGANDRGANDRGAGDGLLCWIDHRGQLELWDRQADRRLAVRQLPTAAGAQLVVGSASCAALAGGGLVVLHREGTVAQPLLGAEPVTALARSPGRAGELLVAAGARLYAVNGGERRRLAELEAPVTAIAATAEQWLLGHRDGRVVLVDRRAGAARRALLDPPEGAVTALVAGPRQTLAAGYASGALALWDLGTGERLALTHLHGPVVHLARAGRRVVAGSSLGDGRALDLDALARPYCEVLREVWKRAPVGWRRGRAVHRPPTADHRCARRRPISR